MTDGAISVSRRFCAQINGTVPFYFFHTQVNLGGVFRVRAILMRATVGTGVNREGHFEMKRRLVSVTTPTSRHNANLTFEDRSNDPVCPRSTPIAAVLYGYIETVVVRRAF